MASISIQGLTKTFPNGTKALDSIDLEIGRSEMVALIGASGSGKSTLIRHIAGLVTAAESTLLLPAPSIEVSLLGPFEVTIDGSPVGLRSGGKPVAVLKYMASIGDQPIARDMILEALWPDVPSGAAGSRLRAAMHALRRMFGGDAAGAVEVLEYELGQYRLFPGATLSTDVARFEAAAPRTHRG